MSLRTFLALGLLIAVAACSEGATNRPFSLSGPDDPVYGVPEGYDAPGYGGPGATGEAPPEVNNRSFR
jgi:hypothetical protein